MEAAMSSDLETTTQAGANLLTQLRTDEYTREQIRMALPANVSMDSFTRATITALMENDQLAQADQRSLFQSIVKCAAMGLLPNGVEAALVIYRTKVKQNGGPDVWVDKVQCIAMIFGVRKVAAGFGWTIHTHAIYSNDRFDVDLGGGRPTHIPMLTGDRGELVGAWAMATHRDGRTPIVEVMRKEDVERAMGSSKGADKEYSPWKRWTDRMWEKTVGHRIAKKLALDPVDAEQLSSVLNASELAAGEAADMLYGPREPSFGELPSGVAPYVRLEDSSAPPQPARTDVTASFEGGDGGSGVVDATAQVEAPGTAAAPPDGGDEEPGLSGPGEEQTSLEGAGALAASLFIPPTGKFSERGEHGPKCLSEILELGADGEQWLKWALGKITAPPPYVEAIWTFARAYAPALYTEAAAKKGLTA